jgi:hypothetical protein
MELQDKLLKTFDLLEEGEEIQRRIWATNIKPLAEHVGIRKVYDEQDTRASLVIVIDSQTDKKDVPAVWSAIQEELEAIVEIQGHDLNDYLQVALQALEDGDYLKLVEHENAPPEFPFRHKLVKSKPEYRDIMMDANFDLLVFAIRASKAAQDAGKAEVANHFLDNLFRLYAGRTKKEDINREIDVWREAAFVDLAEGRCPQDIYDGPITYDKLSNKFELLRERYSHERRPDQSKENLLKVYGHFVVWGDWKDAAEILEQSYPKTFEKYKPRLDGRLSEILQNMGESNLRKDLSPTGVLLKKLRRQFPRPKKH